MVQIRLDEDEWHTHFCWVEHQSTDVAATVALEGIDVSRRCYARDHDVTLFFEIQDERQTKWQVAAKYDCDA